MGSLANFEPIIREKTDIKVKTLDMVTTSLVLEAIRKATILDMDLESIYKSLKDFRGYNIFEQKTSNSNGGRNNAIVTICSTGEGTAIKLMELVKSIVSNITEEKIEIFPVSVRDIDNNIKNIMQKYNIIASVGIINPRIEAPFISIEELISG